MTVVEKQEAKRRFPTSLLKSFTYHCKKHEGNKSATNEKKFGQSSFPNGPVCPYASLPYNDDKMSQDLKNVL